MLKIHSGIYKGQTINRVKVDTTKETASMVREAVFNTLYQVYGNVLDLFAGSGSYGITALSLGAKCVFFVDNNLKAYATIKDNLNKLKAEAFVYRSDYLNYLNRNQVKYDLVFLDPPYNFNNYDELIEKLIPHLNKQARIVLEVDKATIIKSFNNLTIIKEKTYGSKKVMIYQI